MKKCDWYHEEDEVIGWEDQETPVTTLVSRCNGTKMWNICMCGGDREKCDFYPQNKEEQV